MAYAIDGDSVVVSSSALPTGAATAAKQSDGSQKTQIVNAANNVIGSEQSVSGDWHLGVSLEQHVIADPLNATATPLNAGATWTGGKASTLGVAGIQVVVKADQNCDVFIDQSGNGTNYDVIDTYEFIASVGNFGITVQAVGSHYRIRVTNTSSVNQTYLRVNVALCPIVEALPRSLSDDGHLKVRQYGSEDEYGFEAENTPSGEVRAIAPVRLVGASFEAGTIDTTYWNAATLTAPGTVTQAGGRVLLATAPSAGNNGAATLYSVRRARYVSGSANVYRHQGKTDAGLANNNRRWGVAYGATMPTITDGYFFQWKGTVFQCVTRKASSDVEVATGSFNGNMGATWQPTAGVMYTFEIYWSTVKTYFTVNGKILHTVTDNVAPIADTYHHFIFMDNRNSGGIGTNVEMYCRSSSIHRLGLLLAQPTSYYHASATTAGVNLKLGPGNLHSLLIGVTADGAVITLSDSISAATPVLFSTTLSFKSNTNFTPVALDLRGLPFASGLRLTVATAAAGVTVIYE